MPRARPVTSLDEQSLTDGIGIRPQPRRQDLIDDNRLPARLSIAVIEGSTLDALGRLVTDGIGAIDGVTRTTTCVAVTVG